MMILTAVRNVPLFSLKPCVCSLPEVVLQFAGYEGKNEGQQSQKDVIGENAADEDHRAFITLEDDLYILGRGVFDRVRREDDEPHRARYSLEEW